MRSRCCPCVCIPLLTFERLNQFLSNSFLKYIQLFDYKCLAYCLHLVAILYRRLYDVIFKS
jgi:hypothetical protein